jgi:Protein of unknown function (DUF551)
VAWTTDYDLENIKTGFSKTLDGRSMKVTPAFPPHQVVYLYLSAGAQPREPMTEEEIVEKIANLKIAPGVSSLVALIRAIEAHHKIGENAQSEFHIAVLKELADAKQSLLATQGQLGTSQMMLGNLHRQMDQLEPAREGWQPIETAPKGSGQDGPELVTDPDYVAPQKLLLYTAEGMEVGYYDWYYHEGYGHGAEPGVSAWQTSAGQAYSPTHWMPLPAAPTPKEPTK